MSYKVIFLAYAEHDLKNIHAYIESQFSEMLAKKVYTEIRDAILLLEDNPNLGHTIPQLLELGMADYRYIVVGKRNKVVYRIDAGKKQVYIHLICNARQDFEAAFAKRTLEI